MFVVALALRNGEATIGEVEGTKGTSQFSFIRAHQKNVSPIHLLFISRTSVSLRRTPRSFKSRSSELRRDEVG